MAGHSPFSWWVGWRPRVSCRDRIVGAHKINGFHEGNKARENRAESSRRGTGVLSEMLSTLQSLYNNLGGDPPTEGITIQSR